jgi:hypothetical protein
MSSNKFELEILKYAKTVYQMLAPAAVLSLINTEKPY